MNKQETIDEAAFNYGWRVKTNGFSDPVKANELAQSAIQDFEAGAEWAAGKMYSEQEVFTILDKIFHMYASPYRQQAKEFFNKTKK